MGGEEGRAGEGGGREKVVGRGGFNAGKGGGKGRGERASPSPSFVFLDRRACPRLPRRLSLSLNFGFDGWIAVTLSTVDLRRARPLALPGALAKSSAASTCERGVHAVQRITPRAASPAARRVNPDHPCQSASCSMLGRNPTLSASTDRPAERGILVTTVGGVHSSIASAVQPE